MEWGLSLGGSVSICSIVSSHISPPTGPPSFILASPSVLRSAGLWYERKGLYNGQDPVLPWSAVGDVKVSPAGYISGDSKSGLRD